MSKKTEIQKLVEFALSDKLNQHKKMSLGIITKKTGKRNKKSSQKKTWRALSVFWILHLFATL